MTEIATAEERARDRQPRVIVRHSFAIRVTHWWTTITFLYLMLSGFALGYPRMSWLFDILGGGQTVRFLHPWVGVGFAVGLLFMLVQWFGIMLFIPVDWVWLRRITTYAKQGHVELDVDKFNAGQKLYYWFSIVNGFLLLLTGIPLWRPELLPREWNLASRFSHHILFLAAAGFLLIHVYLSTIGLPGTFRSMTSGTVERAWAAFHHPRWFRRVDEKDEL
jgi:formate dehydrogenase gamma subunit